MLIVQTTVKDGYAVTIETEGDTYAVTYGQQRTLWATLDRALEEYAECLRHNLEAHGHIPVEEEC